jgi:hypothetical protein
MHSVCASRRSRHIYEKHGFSIVHKESYNDFGYTLISETWELKL